MVTDVLKLGAGSVRRSKGSYSKSARAGVIAKRGRSSSYAFISGGLRMVCMYLWID
jgi:hypothetical protein